MPKGRYATEAEMVAAYCAHLDAQNAHRRAAREREPAHAHHWPIWTAYHETAGWDLLLVDEDGTQVGIEAKLSLNVKVLTQAIPHPYDDEGPDYRAVLVESVNATSGISALAKALGLTVIVISGYENGEGGFTTQANPDLPNERSRYDLRHWCSWLPAKRCSLPEYIPDVMGGKAAPVTLTPWKVSAIKLLILLERRGVVNRADMRALGLSETRWTNPSYGFLEARRLLGGYVKCSLTPDLKAQHPRNWAEIEADFDKWAPPDWRTPSLI